MQKRGYAEMDLTIEFMFRGELCIAFVDIDGIYKVIDSNGDDHLALTQEVLDEVYVLAQSVWMDECADFEAPDHVF